MLWGFQSVVKLLWTCLQVVESTQKHVEVLAALAKLGVLQPDCSAIPSWQVLVVPSLLLGVTVAVIVMQPLLQRR